ncbi:MAG: hypothetical protein E7169_04610 [Firmicutes bacterium]|nr:hypothetical protein [Bacillota bacterium]
MNIDITRLKHGIMSSISLDENLDTTNVDLNNTGILDLKDIKIIGNITKDNMDNYMLDVKLSGIMVLPCSITLKPVDYEFSTEILGNIEEMLEEINEIHKKTENTIDIFPIIWENILMEIPIKVTSLDALNENISGDGWRLVTEDEEVKECNAFDKLKDLL